MTSGTVMTRGGDDAERSDAEERRIMTDDGKGTDVPGQQGEPGQPSHAELNAMSGEELVALGGRLDGKGTRSPKRPLARTVRRPDRRRPRQRSGEANHDRIDERPDPFLLVHIYHCARRCPLGNA